MHTFARWVSTPENRPAFLAVQRVAECVCSNHERREINPLFLHGPAGTGKTHLVSALANDITRRRPELAVDLVRVDEFRSLVQPARDNEFDECADPMAWQGDVLIVEDLQHLRSDGAETLVQILDGCQAHRRQMVFTASVGPRQLHRLPARLTNRLAAGLVVGLEPFAVASRLAFLQDRAQRRQLAVSRDVLEWLAERGGSSGRQLEGALGRVEELVRLHDRLPDRETVARHFQVEAEVARPTVERIAERVSTYFQVDRRQLQSRHRYRSALVPRQVGMYLARQLTELSLEQIGAYFGGRDHSTVLHACRKIDDALAHDVSLSGAVRQLQADLG